MKIEALNWNWQQTREPKSIVNPKKHDFYFTKIIKTIEI